MRFNPHRQYFAEGYKLSHNGCWKLSFGIHVALTESDSRFWSIVSCYDFRPFETSDEVGQDDVFDGFDSDDRDKNFIPSMGREYESPPGAGHRTLRRLLGFVA